MTAAANMLQKGISQKYQGIAPAHVIKAVQNASQKTGVDFAFLMEKASAESSFNAKAKAKTSSATGLYQFIENTWLGMVKNHGDKYGLGKYADKIDINARGQAQVSDKAARRQILELRNNPEIAALMAGELTAENCAYLERNTKCDVGATEMYLAHFMGAGGAAKFLNSRDVNGDAIAASVFPAAARANKNVFFDGKTGQPRTLNEVYNYFDNKFTGGSSPSPTSAKAPSLAAGSAKAPAAASPSHVPSVSAAQALSFYDPALPSFDDADESDDIIWNDDPRFFPASGGGMQKLASGMMMAVLEMQHDTLPERTRYKNTYNS